MDEKEKLIKMIDKLADIADFYMTDYCERNDEYVLSEEEICKIEDETERSWARELKENDDFLKEVSNFLNDYKSKEHEKSNNLMKNMEIGYELYEQLTHLQKNHLVDFEILNSIESVSKMKLRMEEKNDLLKVIRKVWMKDDEHMSLSWLTNKIMEAYCDKKISLRTLKNAKTADILTCVYDADDFEDLEDECRVKFPNVRADREFIVSLIEVGGLDDYEEFKKMSEQEQASAIEYWIEHYYDDYSKQELEELGVLESDDVEENEM